MENTGSSFFRFEGGEKLLSMTVPRNRNSSYYGPKGYYILWEKCFMNKREFVEYVKNHKKEVALGALGLVGTGLLVAFGVEIAKSAKVSTNPVEMVGDIVSDVEWKERNLVDGFATGKVNDLWNEAGYGNAIVQYFTIKDMGALGEDLKKIGGITDETEVSAVLSFVNTTVEI